MATDNEVLWVTYRLDMKRLVFKVFRTREAARNFLLKKDNAQRKNWSDAKRASWGAES